MKQNSPYKIECIKLNLQDSAFIATWRQLLSDAYGPEKIYQTPEFFYFLQETNNGHDHIELLSISEIESGQLIGVIPIRFRNLTLDFAMGNRAFTALKMKVITLLGSVPLIPLKAQLLEDLLSYLLSQFPSCSAISMAALPRNSAFNTYITDTTSITAQYGVYVMHGWREGHTIPLPDSFENYLQKFSSKKRFNLKRQIRQLKEHSGGELQLERIENPEKVSSLTNALDIAAPPGLRRTFLSEEKLTALAKNGLLLSYILRTADKVHAVIFGTRSEHTLHIHNICYPPDLGRLSVGTSILYLAIEDLTTNFKIKSIDLGYSNPTYTHLSSNTIEIRGHVLIFRKNLFNLFLFFIHKYYFEKIMLLKTFLNQRRHHK